MTASKIVAAAASGVGGAGLDVDEVFSTDLWVGTGSDVVVTTGIDLQNEGGIVWVKNRGRSSTDHTIWTRNDQTGWLKPNTTAAITNQNWIRDWTTTTYTAAGNSTNYASYSGDDYVGWTFRKAPKFFDVVTWTGDGTASRNISHNLKSVPGHVMVKKTSGGSAAGWINWHRTFSDYQSVFLNTTEAVYNPGNINSGVFGLASGFTSTQFQLGGTTNITYHNENNSTYVAYVFAHNNNDGEFGPDSDQDIIKCGSYTGNGASGNAVNLGFEPQWLMVKNVSSSNQNWTMFDSMRGVATGGSASNALAGVAAELFPNDSAVERNAFNIFNFNATGFETDGTLDETNKNGDTFIYMAIRRGSLNKPDDATKVFAMDQGNGSDVPSFQSGYPIDMGIFKNITSTNVYYLSSRLTQGEYLDTTSSDGRSTNSNHVYDYQNGFMAYSYNSSHYSWMWKRAPGYFDVGCYIGTSANNRELKHSLGVVPEMVWFKKRDTSYTKNWAVYHSATGNTNTGILNTDAAWADNSAGMYANPTATSIFLKATNENNGSGQNYIAFFFASLTGISKVGSYSGNGSSQTIDCGFSNGARFVLIKRTDGSGEWYLFDTQRGITNDNDSLLELNTNAAEGTSNDFIDPQSSGFIVNGHINQSSQSYIFYAIA